ncbi:hypothetical protein DL95DRAFT_465641 [Leptodontidium sp. 2 PMI_412]|nr:hypothetical protein DL95DRAFT_465641 [Leptodontidium sp. 2 PMI_412]
MSLSTLQTLSDPSRAFLQFPRLPKELRLLIWAFASIPRILTICKFFSHDKDAQYLYSTDPPPATLHVCHESRKESPYVASFRMGSSPRYSWVNFNVDTIQMHDYILRHIEPKEMAQIRWAILEVDDASDFEAWAVHDVCLMSSLEVLTIYTISDLRSWVEKWDRLLFSGDFTFRGREGLTCPMLKVIERKTGEQLDSLNFSTKSTSLMKRRESQNGYGWEDDTAWERSENRMERRELEISQRNDEVIGPEWKSM